jgi:tetratricopeptide (TPR) repeat protein
MAQLRESERDYPGALFAIGTEQLGAGEFTAGIDTLKRFIAALPNHVNVVAAHEMLARAYAAQENMSEARAQAEIVIQMAPRYAIGHDLLGRILAGQGQFAAAAAQFQAVLALTPADPEARRNLETMRRLAAGPPPAAPVSSSEIHVRP